MPFKPRKPTPKPPSKVRLSKAEIERLPRQPRDYLVSDTEVPRLKLKVTPAGNRSFILRYRNEFGRERKLKLGDYPDLNAASARRIAATKLIDIAAGRDPAEERVARRKSLSLSDVFDRFIDEYGKFHLKQTTLVGYRQGHDRYIAQSLGRRSIASITRQDILELQRHLASTPYAANRTIALIRRLYNWATTNGLYEVGKNPATGVKLYREREIERLLSEDEHTRLGEAIDAVRAAHPGADASLNAIVLLFFTGCRRGEALRIKWADIDFERNRIAFVGAKSGDRTQPMSSELRSWLLDLWSRRTSDYVFPGRKEDDPIKEIKRTWALVRQKAELHDLRLHDIRHNVLSDIAAATDLATAKEIAGHKSIQSTMRYIHARASVTEAALEASARRISTRLLNRKAD